MEEAADEGSVLDSLPDRDRAQVSQAIAVFGVDTVKDLYSKQWEKRRNGLDAVKEKLAAASKEPKDKASYLLQPTLTVLRKGLRDKVFAVSRLNEIIET